MSTQHYGEGDDRYGDEAASGVTVRTRRPYAQEPGGMPMHSGYGPWGYGGGFRARPPVPIETKPFFLTSEFFGVLVLIAAMAIGAATNDGFDARLFWILTTALVAAYVVSRGIAKSGTKSRSWDPREELFQRGTPGQRDS